MPVKKFLIWASRNKTKLVKGIMPLAVVELVLFGIFFLPSGIKENLVLHKNYTDFIDLLGNHYVHEDIQHILNNAIAFPLITLPMMLFLLRFEKNNRLFYKLLLINLLIVPLLTSLIIMQSTRTITTSIERTMGFSAINASLMGSFVMVYICRGLSNLKFKKFFSFMAFIFLVPLMFVLSYSKYVSPAFLMKVIPILSILTVGCIVITFITIPKGVKKRIDRKYKKRSRFVLFYHMITPYVIVIAYSIALFPTNIVMNGSLVGFYNHYVGLILGILTTYFFYEYMNKK
jgi:hypothetical protein